MRAAPSPEDEASCMRLPLERPPSQNHSIIWTQDKGLEPSLVAKLPGYITELAKERAFSRARQDCEVAASIGVHISTHPAPEAELA